MLLTNKSGFIDQARRGDMSQRSVDDLGEGLELDFQQVMAVSTGSPLVLEAADLDADIARLRTLQAAHERDQRSLQAAATLGRRRLDELDQQIPHLDRLIATRTDTKGDLFTATIAGHTHTERKDAGTALRDELARIPADQSTPVAVGTLAGLNLYGNCPPRHVRQVWVDGTRAVSGSPRPISRTISWSPSKPKPAGPRIRLERLDERKHLADETADVERRLGIASPHQQQLDQARRRRRAEIDAELSKLTDDAPPDTSRTAASPSPDTEAQTATHSDQSSGSGHVAPQDMPGRAPQSEHTNQRDAAFAASRGSVTAGAVRIEENGSRSTVHDPVADRSTSPPPPSTPP